MNVRASVCAVFAVLLLALPLRACVRERHADGCATTAGPHWHVYHDHRERSRKSTAESLAEQFSPELLDFTGPVMINVKFSLFSFSIF